MTLLLNPTLPRVETRDPRYTHADFMRLAPEYPKAELIQGELIVMSPAFFAHERLQSFLMTVLLMYVSRFNLGWVLGSRTAVFISDEDTYEPDILFVRRERQSIITERKLLEAPDLVIEILSASTARYDRGRKLQGYAEAGVQELWLIDPYGPAGTQFFQRREGQLVEVAPINGLIHSTTLPNFHWQIHWLWPNTSNELPNPIDVLQALGALEK